MSETTYKPEVLAAMREFRDAKPWRGTVAERKAKFEALHTKLCAAYNKSLTLLLDVPDAERTRGTGCYLSPIRIIQLEGKLSVVTYLHEFAHAVFGQSEDKAVAWSTNLYRRMFPKSAARMQSEGHLIVKPNNEPTD